jgi:hypothetical protein
MQTYPDKNTYVAIAVEIAVRNGRIDDAQAGDFVRCYENALNGYTYLAESAVE